MCELVGARGRRRASVIRGKFVFSKSSTIKKKKKKNLNLPAVTPPKDRAARWSLKPSHLSASSQDTMSLGGGGASQRANHVCNSGLPSSTWLRRFHRCYEGRVFIQSNFSKLVRVLLLGSIKSTHTHTLGEVSERGRSASLMLSPSCSCFIS